MSAALLLDALRRHDLQEVCCVDLKKNYVLTNCSITSIIQSKISRDFIYVRLLIKYFSFFSLSAQGISKLDNLVEVFYTDISF